MLLWRSQMVFRHFLEKQESGKTYNELIGVVEITEDSPYLQFCCSYVRINEDKVKGILHWDCSRVWIRGFVVYIEKHGGLDKWNSISRNLLNL